jgi:hypothetical protein
MLIGSVLFVGCEHHIGISIKYEIYLCKCCTRDSVSTKASTVLQSVNVLYNTLSNKGLRPDQICINLDQV